VVDGPVDIQHEDLADNALAGPFLDYRSRSATAPLPCRNNDLNKHGTAVAGLIASRRNNGLGGSGVAPQARIAAYNAIPLDDGTTAQITTTDIADALGRDLANTHVYNSSWGSPEDGDLHAVDPATQAAITRGLAEGRSGRGAIFVFPSGNGGRRGDMTNFDGYLNLPGTITACAVDRRGKLPSWGEQGENLLVCGLSSGDQTSSVVTTSIRHQYRDDFTGASAAAPMVSGVIALMLEANPGLGWRDVRLILARSARQNDPGDASWQLTRLPGADGSFKRFSAKYGFGVVDAEAAVVMARDWASVDSQALRSCEFSRDANQAGQNFPKTLSSANPSTDQIAVLANQCSLQVLEFVEVELSAQHPAAGNLQVELTGPNGAVSRLASARSCGAPATRAACRQFSNWRFSVNRHLGEDPADTNWSLAISDTGSSSTGSWLGWKLILRGR
jgi:subtilisin-like proprotein convertase family protein